MSDWISVENRFPENPIIDFVIVGREVSSNCPMTMEAQYMGEGRFVTWRFGLSRDIVSVTHWMPLPEPPDPDNLHNGSE